MNVVVTFIDNRCKVLRDCIAAINQGGHASVDVASVNERGDYTNTPVSSTKGRELLVSALLRELEELEIARRHLTGQV